MFLGEGDRALLDLLDARDLGDKLLFIFIEFNVFNGDVLEFNVFSGDVLIFSNGLLLLLYTGVIGLL